MARVAASSVFASFHLLLYFFSARNAKRPPGSAADASVCAQRGRAGRRQSRGGGRDVTTTSLARCVSWAFLRYQNLSRTDLTPFGSATELLKFNEFNGLMGFQRKKLQTLEEMQGEWKERKVFYTDPSIPIVGAVLKSWSPGSHSCCSDKAK